MNSDDPPSTFRSPGRGFAGQHGVMPSGPHRLDRQRAALVLVDLQERLLPAMHEPDRVLRNSLRLAQGAQILGLPVVITEQYPKGIGRTVPELLAALPGLTPREKMTFSACGIPGFGDELRARKITQVVLGGIEAHVCVTQTCLDFMDEGLMPFVAADAVSSRTAENREFGVERMRSAGAVIGSTEMWLFELLGAAGTEEFKRILPLVK